METILLLALSCAVVIRITYPMIVTTPGSTDGVQVCGNITCSLNSKCVINSNGNRCQCHSGYRGESCYDDTNECTIGNPCLHRGYCHNTIGSYWCDCLDGWNGTDHCAENITEVRDCVPGWTGEWCEICKDNATGCSSRGYCKKFHGKNEYYCVCDPGWSGSKCTLDRDECIFHNPCRHSGRCTNTIGSYRCDCANGWTGTNCEDDVDECVSKPCKNSGTCINNNGSYTCKCPPEWQGQTCTDDIDECKSSPCLNSGTCRNEVGSYKCTCPAEWTGPVCEDKSICAVEKPCRNSASCILIANNTYQCLCADGWQGVNCTEDVDECNTTRFVHVESCINSIGSYSYNCTHGWQGVDCNEAVNEGSSSSSTVGIITGSAIGTFLVILAAVLALLYKCKRKRKPSVADMKEGNEIGNNSFKSQVNRHVS